MFIGYKYKCNEMFDVWVNALQAQIWILVFERIKSTALKKHRNLNTLYFINTEKRSK